MFKISRITFENFKIFRDFKLDINENINIFVGDNGSGKSSILQGIELALCGSATRIRNIGLENLININAIRECLSKKDLKLLPKLVIEIYLTPCTPSSPLDETYLGEHNKFLEENFGVKLVCEPIEDYMTDIKACIQSENPIFPYELYRVHHLTFKGERFSSYNKPIKTSFIDSSEIDSKYALKNTVKETYLSSVSECERAKNRQNYKALVGGFQFAGAADDKGICISSNLEDNLSIEQSGVHIENLGKGEISVIKTNYALNQSDKESTVIFLEEPENHLTHCRMRKLIQDTIEKANTKQFFIATHSSLITTRLGLDNVFFLSREGTPISLRIPDKNTSEFFKKSPSDNLLQFILSRKAILVEGAAEYILMEHFYRTETGVLPEQEEVWIISVNGVSFPRFLQIAQLIKNRVAVIRDNDGSLESRYNKYRGDNIQVFTDSDVNRHTFEISMYEDNKSLCDRIFKNDPLKKMLTHKTEAAYRLLQETSSSTLVIPDYIKKAISWVRK